MAEPIRRRGLMLVLSSPSGAGKTTLARRLLEADDNISLSISVTTRPPRPGEENGRDYTFVDQATFDAMVEDDAFLEHAVVFGNCYGTPTAPVFEALESGHDVLFDIDWQGTQQLAEKAGSDLVSIFILPPSTEELERRLRARALDPEDVVAGRMAKAAEEMSHWLDYGYVLVNDDIDESHDKVVSILEAERSRRERQVGLYDFVNQLREGR